MESTLFPYLASLLLLLVLTALPLIFFIRNHVSGETKLPPGATGWPLVGESMRFTSLGARRFMEERMSKYSPQVFQTSLVGEKMAVFCGAAGNKFLFSNEKLVKSWWPQSMSEPFKLPSDEDDQSPEVAARRRSFRTNMLRPDALKTYIPVMDALMRKHVDTRWAPNDVVKVLPLAKQYTFALACQLFMNIDDPKLVNNLVKHFTLVTSGMFCVPINLPGTAYYRAIKGGKVVLGELMKIVTEKRKEITDNKDTASEDLLSRMIVTPDESGKFMGNAEICNQIIGFLIAGYDTTSIIITFVLKHLAEFPQVYDKVYKEQMEIAKSKGPNEPLNWEDIQNMKYSWCVGCESLRLAPPAQGAFRETTTDFIFAGYNIPKGWKTFWSVYTTHQNPTYFPNPEKFDPSRFEGSGPTPFSFVPFGGGPRMCPGKEYARLEVLVVMHIIVTRFKLEKVDPDEKIIDGAFPHPTNGMPIRLITHKK